MNLGSIRRRLIPCVGLATLILLPACSDADPVPSSTGSIAFSVQASTTGTGRYEGVTFSVARLRVRAVDALGNTLQGGKQLELAATPVPGNVAPGATVQTRAMGLPAGRYRVELLELTPAKLTDTTVPLPTPTSCIENFATVPPPPPPPMPQVPGVAYDSSQLTGPEWLFDITAGAQELSLTVDAPALVELIETSFTCDDSGGTAVLTSFDNAAYANGLPPLLGMHR